jgi:molybdenum cofactor cytidylyltransferase
MAKQLLVWHGEPLIKHVAQMALDCKLDPVIVVTGFRNEDVEYALDGLPVGVVYNTDWRSGQSTSIQKGVKELGDDIAACIFFMSDQPQIKRELVTKIIKKYAIDDSQIIAPRVKGIRGNPVLFDRSTFSGLMSLKNNQGGRELFTQHAVTFVEWQDESILLDVDTLEDYQQLKMIEK